MHKRNIQICFDVSTRPIPVKRTDEDQVRSLSSEDKLKSIIKVAPAGIGITIDRVFQEVNDRVCEMTGYTREELIGKDARMVYPDDEEYASVGREKYGQIARQGSGQVETRWKRKDGGIIDVLLASTPIDETNHAHGVVFTATDFTEKRQIQDAREQSEIRFRTLAETAMVGIVISDKNERVVYINRRFTEMFGYTAEQILSVNEWYRLAYPDKHYRKKVQEEWENYISSQIKGESIGHPLEYSVTCSDGSVKRIEFKLTTIDNHNFIFFLDHTERYEAEAAIRESERKLSTLMDNLPGMAYRCRNDKNWTMEFISSGGKEITGYKASSLIENRIISYDELIHPDDRSMVKTIIEKALKNHEKFILEYRIFDHSGNERWVWEKGMGVDKEGGDYDYIEGIIMDITDRKRSEVELSRLKDDLEIQVNKKTSELNEKVHTLDQSQKALIHMVEDLNAVGAELKAERVKLERSNKELEAFTYSVSHDLRAPLRAINGFSQFLKEDYADKLDEEGKRFIGTIRDNAAKMDRLITDLLSLSRVSKVSLAHTSVEMQGIATSMYYEMASKKEQEEFTIQMNVMPVASCDPSLIKLVWQNLIGNALKYSAHSNEKHIEMGGNEEKDEMVYYISDKGAGFNEKYTRKLFGIFQRLHTSEEFEGTGVGLAIVQRIIHRHGGRVWAKGEVNRGATFYFSLPK